MTRAELFVAAGLVFVVGFGLWMQAPVADEVDPVYLEAMAYSEKTPVHMESTKSIWACNDRRTGAPRQCELMAIGQATSEKGGAYGEQVKVAIEDTREHMRAWMADHPPETGFFTKTPYKGWRIYR
ncbi:hypothetical protein [Pseudomonas putida]|uniref:Uncharacterized protein n=1 Tax=Pseudomonas putida TaxID=303 RepID=A0A8I1JGC4_PSEPU|nr:hypothetical protein [Pseudomonas putida]MBI6882667.1 hypothetical protein [Pseudomonas putida]